MTHATPAIVMILALIGAPTAASDLEITTEIIAVTGEPAWDDPAGVFDRLRLPIISQSSMVGFRAEVDFQGTEVEGLYLWENGVGQRLVQGGEPFGQHPTFVYDRFGDIRIDNSGQIAFKAINQFSQSSNAILIGYPGDFRIVALGGPDDNPEPDYAQGPESVGDPYLTRSGRLAFTWGPQQIRELWGGDENGVQLLAASPIQAPGYPKGVTVRDYSYISANEAGGVSVNASLSGDVSGGTILIADPDTIEIPIGPGITPPGLNLSIDSAGRSTMNGRGDLGFRATFSPAKGGANGDATGVPNQAVFVGSPDALTMIASMGQVPPGFPEEAIVTGIDGFPSVTVGGKVVIVMEVTDNGYSRAGAFRWNGEELEFLFQSFDPVVNLPDTAFTYFGGGSGATQSAVNDRGRFAFIGRLDVPSGESTKGLLVNDQCGKLHAVAFTGQIVEFAPGDLRIIESIAAPHLLGSGPLYPLSGDDGAGTFLNDADELVYWLKFHDNSEAIFLTTLANVFKGDLDNDCTIGPADLAIMLGSWGPCPDKGDCPADIDGDGVVGPSDLAILLGNWG